MADEQDSTEAGGNPLTRSAEVVGNILAAPQSGGRCGTERFGSRRSRGGSGGRAAKLVGTAATGMASSAMAATAPPRRAVRRTVDAS